LGFYGPYDAHRLCEKFPDLGIEILSMRGPRFCRRCALVTTEQTCAHNGSDLIEISGTEIRRLLRNGIVPPPEMMRAEIAELLIDAQRKGELFC
jgi:sulfate adenylyltransferase